ncbi:MAG: HAD-IB family hydrolase [Thermoleophilaceae bacterium]|nr:HAD-IB family hydrolase [Thermoleophilaceae bacterium]
MATLAELVDRIEASEPAPETLACFDYDGTLIGGYSAQAFYSHRIRNREIGPIELSRTLLASVRGIHSDEDFATFLELSLGAWKGVPEEQIEALGERLFRSDIATRLHSEAWELVEAHRRMGHTLALASSATRFQVEPMAKELGIEHALSTPVEVIDGMLTGRTAGPPLWGVGKAEAMRELATTHGLDLDASFAYSNGGEDIPMLESVAHPVAVEPASVLRDHAEAAGWPVLRCSPRGGRPSPIDLARTVGFYGAFAGALGVGAGLGLLNRSRELLLEITGGVGADVGLALAGVKVDILEGQEHLWSSRPAVFVFNHESNMDAIVMMKLLRGNFTGVAKAEAKNIPGFGQFFQLAGVAFIERGNTKQALDALEPAVAKVRDEGVSLVLSPEGTRSLTPDLGRFRKGAFHIAMQAGVPIVPIVLRGAGEVLRRNTQTIRPGTIEVAVLAPVRTDTWKPETVDDHVKEVRDAFIAKRTNWPTHRPHLPAPENGRPPTANGDP